jgi:hypothetical protein
LKGKRGLGTDGYQEFNPDSNSTVRISVKNDQQAKQQKAEKKDGCC